MSQCTCTKDAQMTCIVHPTEASLKARIAELESVMQDAKQVIERQREERLKLEAEDQLFNKTFDAQQVKIERLREALQHITRMNDHNFRVSDIHDVAKAALLGVGDE